MQPHEQEPGFLSKWSLKILRRLGELSIICVPEFKSGTEAIDGSTVIPFFANVVPQRFFDEHKHNNDTARRTACRRGHRRPAAGSATGG
jgi:hypothetical protein